MLFKFLGFDGNSYFNVCFRRGMNNYINLVNFQIDKIRAAYAIIKGASGVLNE